MVVNSLIVSCIDYCNALYIGINASDLKHLQLIQNAASKCIFGKKKRESMNDDLAKLHWLPVKKRIVYKILLLMYKSIIGKAPEYLKELISVNPGTNSSLLMEKKYESNYGKRAFSIIGPRLWNKLHNDVKSCLNIEHFKKITENIFI